ncbi:outer membrane protein TolC [Flavobacterium croceum DSM 17960]|uniref:Outer membrane protein TolC n=1 Tax=Flavobacterium croceum DSM 17960 TaxID=1121886 RepID=A0A2S4N608_9FLAO|nr:TolC family protein [Flavobacterium croceum]POS01149.1 outer membrane protein TolC [Flavobacterium croceum DSM 17960]
MNKIVALLLFFTSVVYSQNISLLECYQLAEKNYPLAQQISLLDQKNNFDTKALSKNKLPKIDVNAQVTYQSEVTMMPISLPNVSISPLNKDQYRTTLDVTQLIYNGGLTDASIKSKAAQTASQKQSVLVNLYQLKPKINQYYFTVLLYQEKIELLKAKQQLLLSKIKEIKVAVKNGAVLPASEQVLEVENIKIDQQITDFQTEKLKNISNLSQVLGAKIADDAKFQYEFSEITSTRPEYEYFNLKNKEIELSKQVLDKSRLPKINAFAQLGYGNPALNMLKNSFESFYYTGIKLNWNLFDWNKIKIEKQSLLINSQIIETEKEVFDLNKNAQRKETELEIQKLKSFLQQDQDIIALREKILKSADAQMRNGVITSADYLVEATNLFEAKTNEKLHKVQLYLAQANYQIIK